MLTCISGASDNTNVCSSPVQLQRVAASPAIRELARRHDLKTLRWWPPNGGDFLVEDLPVQLSTLRSELEAAVGCKVAIYVTDLQTPETRSRLNGESIDLLGT
jgi:hypothetical protein